MRKIHWLILGSFLVTACSMPATQVQTIDDRPRLMFKGAPEGAQVFVDGIPMGEAGTYDGNPHVLVVEEGTHEVTVTAAGGAALYQRKIFVESELKTIHVR